MIKRSLFITCTCLVLGAFSAVAADKTVLRGGPTGEYVRLLNSSKMIVNYKEMAAVSARVFATRAQGSDKEFARFMKVVSTADLSDIDGCIINLYVNLGLTVDDAAEVSSFFETPFGTKLLSVSQQMLVGDIERGYHASPPADTFTSEEQQKAKDANQNAAFRRYNVVVASREFMSGVTKCLVASKDVRRSGIKL